MTKGFLIMVALAALAAQSIAQDSTPEIDESKPCMHYCSADIASVEIAKSAFYSMFITEFKHQEQFGYACGNFTALACCYQKCPDGRTKSTVTALLEPLVDACSESRKSEITDILTCINGSLMKPWTICPQVFGPIELVNMEAISYEVYEKACNHLTAPNKMSTAVICSNATCYYDYITNSTKSTDKVCHKVNKNAWMHLMDGIFRPALVRPYQACNVPVELIPDTCKQLLGNDGDRMKPLVLGAMLLVMGLLKSFVSV